MTGVLTITIDDSDGEDQNNKYPEGSYPAFSSLPSDHHGSTSAEHTTNRSNFMHHSSFDNKSFVTLDRPINSLSKYEPTIVTAPDCTIVSERGSLKRKASRNKPSSPSLLDGHKLSSHDIVPPVAKKSREELDERKRQVERINKIVAETTTKILMDRLYQKNKRANTESIDLFIKKSEKAISKLQNTREDASTCVRKIFFLLETLDGYRFKEEMDRRLKQCKEEGTTKNNNSSVREDAVHKSIRKPNQEDESLVKVQAIVESRGVNQNSKNSSESRTRMKNETCSNEVLLEKVSTTAVPHEASKSQAKEESRSPFCAQIEKSLNSCHEKTHLDDWMHWKIQDFM